MSVKRRGGGEAEAGKWDIKWDIPCGREIWFGWEDMPWWSKVKICAVKETKGGASEQSMQNK